MYKRLYEEERKSRNSSDALPKGLPGRFSTLILALFSLVLNYIVNLYILCL